jgi:hypothetical protein
VDAQIGSSELGQTAGMAPLSAIRSFRKEDEDMMPRNECGRLEILSSRPVAATQTASKGDAAGALRQQGHAACADARLPALVPSGAASSVGTHADHGLSVSSPATSKSAVLRVTSRK